MSAKDPKSLADVISIARTAQQNAFTPEQIAEDARREAMQRRAHNLSMARPSIPPAAVQAIIDDTLDETPHLPGLRDFLSGSKRVLVLAGGVGAGKTVAACYALARHGGKFVLAPELSRMSTDFNREPWDALVGAFITVVDDVGDEPRPADFVPALTQLISERSRHLGRTILTTNMNATQMQERYPDPRLWSRIKQSVALVSLEGSDLRGKS